MILDGKKLRDELLVSYKEKISKIFENKQKENIEV